MQSTTSTTPRVLTLLSTALIVLAAGLQSASAATVPAPEPAPETVGEKFVETDVLIGAAVRQNAPRLTVPEEIAFLESKGISLEIRRVFDPNDPFKASFMDLGGLDVGIRATHYSFKPDMNQLVTGALDAKVNGLLDSIPAGHRTMLTIWHEPEDNFTTEAAQATYRAAWQHFADLVHATGRAELTTTWVMMAWSWRTASHRDPMDWYPGDAYVDSVGIDTYNEGSLDADGWDSPGRGLGLPFEGDEAAPGGFVYGGAIPWIQSRGLAWGVSEFGTLENVNHIDSEWAIVDEKHKWIKQATRFYIREGASFVEYFHSGPTRGPWWLDSSPEALASYAWATLRY